MGSDVDNRLYKYSSTLVRATFKGSPSRKYSVHHIDSNTRRMGSVDIVPTDSSIRKNTHCSVIDTDKDNERSGPQEAQITMLRTNISPLWTFLCVPRTDADADIDTDTSLSTFNMHIIYHSTALLTFTRKFSRSGLSTKGQALGRALGHSTPP